jgi:hypothetical protein
VSVRKEMVGDYKHCPGCDKWLHRDNYNKHSKRHTGLSDHCRSCCSDYAKKHYVRNSEKTIKRMLAYRQTLEGHAKALILSARTRAKKYSLEFEITNDWVLERLRRGVCEKSGLKFAAPRTGGRVGTASSIDRIDPKQGYTFRNAQVVCNMYNTGKNQHLEIDFIAMCCAVAERHAHRPEVIQRLKELRNAEF